MGDVEGEPLDDRRVVIWRERRRPQPRADALVE
jgi:hypothetical protein